LFWENRIFAILLWRKHRKKLSRVVKVELRQKTATEKSGAAALPIELAKTGRFTTTPSMSEIAMFRQ
jgi:hypothetical protein